MRPFKVFLSLILIFAIFITPGYAKGESTNQLEVKTSSIQKASEPKKSLKESSKSIFDPNEYPLVDEGDYITTLVDSLGSYHNIYYNKTTSYDTNHFDFQILYNSNFAYFKDPVITIEFFEDMGGTLEYSGKTEFNTSGGTDYMLHSYISKSMYAGDPYIYVRLGVSSSSDDLYYSDVTQFKVKNPEYHSTPNNGADAYELISNESVDEYSIENVGSFKINNDKYTFNKKLTPDAYRMDYVKPFDSKKYRDKLIKRSQNFIQPHFSIGDSKNFWVADLVDNSYYQINAKLLYSGKKVNVWVNNDQITATDASKLGQEFENHIYPSVTNNFGKESDVNGDGKINILCYDIQDGFSGSGGYVAGYFDPSDLYNMSFSNYSEIFYIDTYPLMGMSTSKDVSQAYSTLAHEFQHMVNYNQNVLIEHHDDMDTWLDEGLAMAAEQIYEGTALQDRIDYYNYSDSIAEGHSLLYWDNFGDTLANYSLSYLFVQYLKIQAGQGNAIFKEIINDPNSNYLAVEDVIKKHISANLSFGKFMTDFRAALLLKQASGLYGFKGDPAFNTIEPRLSDGYTTYLHGGGAIARAISTSDFFIPADKGPDITYTLLNLTDTTPPDPPKVNPVSDKDTTVTGSTEALAQVYVTVNGKQIGYGSADSSGEFKVSIPKQKAGTTLTVYAQDQAGNKSTSVSVKVVDKTPPGTPKVNPVSDRDTSVTGTAEANAKVYITTSGKQIGYGSTDSSGKFKVSIPKQKAGTTLTIYAQDQAGNKSTSVSVKVVDKTPPGTPKVNPVSDRDTSVTGTSEAYAKVYITTSGKQIGYSSADSSGKFKASIPKQKAGTTLTIYAQDQAGNKSASVSVKVADKTPPGKPKVNSVSDKDTFVTGTTEAYAKVFVTYRGKTIGSATASSSGKFKVTIHKQKAGTILTIYVQDKAGNKSSSTSVKVADKTPPGTPTVNRITTKTVYVTGKAETGSTVYIYNGSKLLGKGKVSSKGTFKIKIKPQKRNTTLKIYAKDSAGNKSGYRSVRVK